MSYTLRRDTRTIIDCKVCLLGNQGVGKSSVLRRYLTGMFDAERATINEANVISKQCEDETTINLHVWDTAGQERYKSLCKFYFRGCRVYIIFYDISKKTSFDDVEGWHEMIKDNHLTNDEYHIFLCGNKIDLVSERQVETTVAQIKMAKLNAVRLCETSALSGDGVIELFNAIVATVRLDPLYGRRPTDPESVSSNRRCCR